MEVCKQFKGLFKVKSIKFLLPAKISEKMFLRFYDRGVSLFQVCFIVSFCLFSIIVTKLSLEAACNSVYRNRNQMIMTANTQDYLKNLLKAMPSRLLNQYERKDTVDTLLFLKWSIRSNSYIVATASTRYTLRRYLTDP